MPALKHEALAPRTRQPARPAAPVTVANHQPWHDLGAIFHRSPSCACGGACPRCQDKARLRIGAADSVNERDAVRVADQVMRPAQAGSIGTARPTGLPPASTGTGPVGESSEALLPAPAVVHRTLAAPGRGLDAATRAFFEPALGLDLGSVRIHDGPVAAASARAIGARAYTAGSAIVFGSSEYDTSGGPGRTLLAHELAHVRQHSQTGGPATLLHRTPCPSCHKPQGTQRVTLEELVDNDVFYLPDEDAAEYFTYLRAGLYWGEYEGGRRTRARGVHYYNYDGSSMLVGYVLNFSNPQGSNFTQPVITIDIHGKVLDQSSTDPQAIESVLSPVDFIGPGFLARPAVSGARAVFGGIARTVPKFRAAAGNTARGLAFSARLNASNALGAAMRGGAEFPALAAGSTAPASLVVRQGGELAVGTAQAGRVATGMAEGAPAFARAPVQATGPSFADVSRELGLQAAGTVSYRSTAAAAAAARAARLETASRPGFQTHSTAPTVRQAFSVSGSQWQSAHIVPQAVYRALRAQGLAVSEGRALTTLLPRQAHAAFDRLWIREWNQAVATGRTIRVGDVYRWVSRAINAVDDRVIDKGVKGAIDQRLKSELFNDLGLALDDVLLPGVL